MIEAFLLRSVEMPDYTHKPTLNSTSGFTNLS